jgi:uncharacterized paraquat-inducible protein A
MKTDQDLYELAQHLEKIKGKETQFSLGFSGRLISTKKRLDDPWARGFTYVAVIFIAGIISSYFFYWENWRFIQTLPFWMVAAAYIGVLNYEEIRMRKSHEQQRIMITELNKCPVCQYTFDTDGIKHFQQYSAIVCPICHSKFGKKKKKEAKGFKAYFGRQ